MYGRMILLMAVSLYTSRVVLNALGVADYGVYSVVGGVVAMIGFLNSSLTSSTQRFLNVEMAVGDAQSLNVVFCQSVNVHILITIVSVIILETVGLWFVYNKLVIPEGQLSATLWVFQCSIVSFALTILSAPYNAAIIANEKMSLFAWLSVLDGFLRLLVAYIISAVHDGRLKLYATLLLGVSLIMRFIYSGFCVRLFKECRYYFIIKWHVMKKMLSFSGWMIFGSLSDVLATQGVNMLINVFFGPIYNASRALAVQVQGAVSQFSTNFMISVNPQIVKQYSSGQKDRSFELVAQFSKYSFFMMLLIVVPISIRMNDLFKMWLGHVPVYTSLFAQLILVELLIRSTCAPLTQINVAYGKVRVYQLSVALLFLSTFIGSYILFKNDFPVYSTFVLSLCIAVVGLFTRLAILKKQNGFPVGYYFKSVSVPSLEVAAISVCLGLGIDKLFSHSIAGTIGSCLFCFVAVAAMCWCVGLKSNERNLIISKIRSVVHNISGKA